MVRDDGGNRRLVEFEAAEDGDTIECVACGTDYKPDEAGYSDGRCPDCRGHP